MLVVSTEMLGFRRQWRGLERPFRLLRRGMVDADWR
jgi:hypothetical protein